MKIAIVNSEYPTPSGADHGGIATYTATLAHLLARSGHTVHICTRSGTGGNTDTPGIRYHHFGFIKSPNFFLRIAARFVKTPLSWERGQARALNVLLAQIAATDGLDIVEFPEYGALASDFTHRPRIPCIITFHTPAELVDRYNNVTPLHVHRRRYALEQAALKRASAFKSPSNALKEWVCGQYGLPDSSVRHIRNPFDPTPLHKINPAGDPSSSRFDILFTGRFERRKGAEVLLHSIRTILAIDDAITFTIAGETETGNAPNYRQAIERLLSPQERSRVWFPGPLSRQKLLPLYRNSSLFLFPSLFENSPYALIEAMAAGLPVVATAGSGIGEIVTHDETGLLFPADDHAMLATHIRDLLKNRERAIMFGRNAASEINRLFDPETIVAAHLAHYESICRNDR